jgi:hypothetical protein
MPLKKIAIITIVLLIPSFVSFIMCPVSHTLTVSKCQQLLIGQQQFQKGNYQQKEHADAPLWNPSFSTFYLQAYHKIIVHSLQPALTQERSNTLTLLKTTKLNV